MIATAETPQSMYTDAVKASYSSYSDAAIVVITRIGGEGFDLPRYQGTTEGAVSPDSHYLELDRNERDLLNAVCNAGFGHVIVLFNIPSAFEATFLRDKEYLASADRIDAAMWIGFTGGEGIMALGEILNGEVNPSGRTVDTWSADFSSGSMSFVWVKVSGRLGARASKSANHGHYSTFFCPDSLAWKPVLLILCVSVSL